MAFRFFLYFCIFLVIAIQTLFSPIPLGNDRAKVKRVPIITILIVLVNVAAFVLTIQRADEQDEKLTQATIQLRGFFESHPTVLLFEDIQRKVKDAGLVQDGEVTALRHKFKMSPADDNNARRLLGEASANQLRTEFDTLIGHYEEAQRAHVFYNYGLAPNGRWKPYQLVTSMFLHGNFSHIAGNMIFFAALAISLEALWGRTIFLVFYLIVGVAAAIPGLIVPFDGPMIGASGAISGIMGAFLVSLHKTKIKVGWLSLPLFYIFILLKKKPFGIWRIPAYLFLPYFFFSELLMWWFFKQMKLVSGTAHSVHVGGFFFGVCFAVILEYVNLKTNFFGLDYSESLVAAELRELTEAGQFGLAEQKIKAFLAKHPEDMEAWTALGQVSHALARYDQMNDAYCRVIRHHLARSDKHAALLSYDALLTGFPENQITPSVPINDWMAICDYLQKEGMTKEAAVEYERLANAGINSPLTLRACVQGGEAALSVKDHQRAARLFQLALTLRPSPSHEPRIRRGLDRCEVALKPPIHSPAEQLRPTT